MVSTREAVGVRVRLTDQALTAVAVARQAAGSRRPHVADLLVGLAAEPEGLAARPFHRRGAAAAALTQRAASASTRLPSLETAIGWAAREVADRPLWTSDLLVAALVVGGSDLADLLETCGIDPADLDVSSPDDLEPWVAALDGPHPFAETTGYDPGDTTRSAPAARAVARARAVGGGAVALVVALAAERDIATEEVPMDADEVVERLRRLTRAGATLTLPHPTDDDRGLDPVVEAAERVRDPSRPVRPVDLLRAAALVGGRQAAALLAPAETRG